MTAPAFRLVTRSDFDGLICAVLFKELGMIDEITFVHPKDVQDGKVPLGPRDITTNLPYCPDVHLCFDHHFSETLRTEGRASNAVIRAEAPSAARVVYDYYGGKKIFTNIPADMLEAVDKADAAQFSTDEILHPSGWVLLNYIMDPRTGLGRFRNFRISNYELMMELIELCRTQSIDAILETPDVKERCELYFEQQDKALAQLREHTTLHGKTLVLDLREADPIWCTNRFTIYALYPECNVSIHVLWGLQKRNTVLAVGKSIVNRSSTASIGEIMLGYGGGGHKNAGTCQVANEDAEKVLKEVLAKLQG